MIKLKYLGIILLAIGLGACGTVEEEITFNNDGSGSYEISSDIIPMLRGMMKPIAQMSVESGDSVEIAEKVEEMIWKDFGEDFDSTMVIDPETRAEFEGDPEKLAMMEKTHMHMHGGKAKGYVKTSVKFNFDNRQEFEVFTEMLEERNEDDNEKMGLPKSSTTLEMKDKYFKRTIIHTEPKEKNPNAAQIQNMLGSMLIITKINFPGKIKSVNLTGYTLVEKEGSTLVVQQNVLESMQSGKSEIEVFLK